MKLTLLLLWIFLVLTVNSRSTTQLKSPDNIHGGINKNLLEDIKRLEKHRGVHTLDLNPETDLSSSDKEQSSDSDHKQEDFSEEKDTVKGVDSEKKEEWHDKDAKTSKTQNDLVGNINSETIEKKDDFQKKIDPKQFVPRDQGGELSEAGENVNTDEKDSVESFKERSPNTNPMIKSYLKHSKEDTEEAILDVKNEMKSSQRISTSFPLGHDAAKSEKGSESEKLPTGKKENDHENKDEEILKKGTEKESSEKELPNVNKYEKTPDQLEHEQESMKEEEKKKEESEELTQKENMDNVRALEHNMHIPYDEDTLHGKKQQDIAKGNDKKICKEDFNKVNNNTHSNQIKDKENELSYKDDEIKDKAKVIHKETKDDKEETSEEELEKENPDMSEQNKHVPNVKEDLSNKTDKISTINEEGEEKQSDKKENEVKDENSYSGDKNNVGDFKGEIILNNSKPYVNGSHRSKPISKFENEQKKTETNEKEMSEKEDEIKADEKEINQIKHGSTSQGNVKNSDSGSENNHIQISHKTTNTSDTSNKNSTISKDTKINVKDLTDSVIHSSTKSEKTKQSYKNLTTLKPTQNHLNTKEQIVTFQTISAKDTLTNGNTPSVIPEKHEKHKTNNTFAKNVSISVDKAKLGNVNKTLNTQQATVTILSTVATSTKNTHGSHSLPISSRKPEIPEKSNKIAKLDTTIRPKQTTMQKTLREPDKAQIDYENNLAEETFENGKSLEDPDTGRCDPSKQYSGSALVAATVGGIFIGAIAVYLLFHLKQKCKSYVNGDYRRVPMEYDFELNPRFKAH